MHIVLATMASMSFLYRNYMLKKNVFLFLLIITPLMYTPNTTCSWFSKPTKKQIIIGSGVGVAFVCVLAYFYFFRSSGTTWKIKKSGENIKKVELKSGNSFVDSLDDSEFSDWNDLCNYMNYVNNDKRDKPLRDRFDALKSQKNDITKTDWLAQVKSLTADIMVAKFETIIDSQLCSLRSGTLILTSHINLEGLEEEKDTIVQQKNFPNYKNSCIELIGKLKLIERQINQELLNKLGYQKKEDEQRFFLHTLTGKTILVPHTSVFTKPVFTEDTNEKENKDFVSLHYLLFFCQKRELKLPIANIPHDKGKVVAQPYICDNEGIQLNKSHPGNLKITDDVFVPAGHLSNLEAIHFVLDNTNR